MVAKVLSALQATSLCACAWKCSHCVCMCACVCVRVCACACVCVHVCVCVLLQFQYICTTKVYSNYVLVGKRVNIAFQYNRCSPHHYTVLHRRQAIPTSYSNSLGFRRLLRHSANIANVLHSANTMEHVPTLHHGGITSHQS